MPRFKHSRHVRAIPWPSGRWRARRRIDTGHAGRHHAQLRADIRIEKTLLPYSRHVRISTRSQRIRSSCPCYERRSCSCPTIVTDPAGSQKLYCCDRSVCFFLLLLHRRSFCGFPPSYHVVVVRRRHRPAAGRAMVHTHGSEPCVNQNIVLPLFLQSYGSFHARQCYTVCYAILTILDEARRAVGSRSFYFFLAGRGKIMKEKTVPYGTQSAPLSPPTAGQSFTMGAGLCTGGDQTLVVCCRYFFFHRSRMLGTMSPADYRRDKNMW